MRITTWNVNGIRAVVNKDGFSWLDEVKPDILGLQEIKAKPEQVPQLLLEHPEYQSFWHSAERPGYSGTAVLYKQEPLSIQTGWTCRNLIWKVAPYGLNTRIFSCMSSIFLTAGREMPAYLLN
jgi:exodeoxyribonuclease III